VTYILNQAEIEASLKRAARLGVSGTPKERSGQSGGSPADIAMRLRDELRIAMMNWATVEAFNNSFEMFRDTLISHAAWQPPMFAVRAVVRDVILTLMRVTDPPQEELQTISRILGLFDGKTTLEISNTTGADEVAIQNGLEFLHARVPLSWGKNQPLPTNGELVEARTIFEPIRNSLIAHAKIYSSLDLRRDVKRTREFLILVSKLSEAACMICNVPRDDPQERWDSALREAQAFWQIVAEGARPK
jgi:hypothetical protein